LEIQKYKNLLIRCIKDYIPCITEKEFENGYVDNRTKKNIKIRLIKHLRNEEDEMMPLLLNNMYDACNSHDGGIFRVYGFYSEGMIKDINIGMVENPFESLCLEDLMRFYKFIIQVTVRGTKYYQVEREI
jgi:hypothetical protein